MYKFSIFCTNYLCYIQHTLIPLFVSISDQEMIVGIHNRANGQNSFASTDIITVPIIEAKPNEQQLLVS